VGVREHVDAGAVRAKPSRAYYYLTEVDRAWPSDRQKEHMRDFNIPDALEHLDSRGVSRPLPALPASASRRVEGPQVDALRPVSFVEGWAHYCEQMMVEAGFRRGDVTIRLGQLAESLGAIGALRRRDSPAL
jgi:hypothetical protein